ncbi:DNA repair ATPase [Nocardia rhizosphaerae]|uniref:DNA repair ATPase n=1 Tax=Nocardia rhizosphaerae TaxID=1691571 RepID=A0ABV8L9Y2_9NOCA
MSTATSLPDQNGAVAEMQATAAGAAMDGSTYEVLRARLHEQAGELAQRCEELNDRRVEGFGGIELALLGTEHIRTEHNCVPRDIVGLADGRMLFGYNVFLGLKPQTEIGDVFAAHRFDRTGTDFGFAAAEQAGLLDDPRLRRDFTELYRYYSQTHLLQLRRLDGRILAVFQTGQRTDDIKVLRWQVDSDGSVRYLDNRGEREHVFPPSHEFAWTETTRADQVLGRHPHLSILGRVFVETIGGTLTVKVENNTETGTGIYSEPVAEPLQSLADADVHYAEVGALILLRIRPYNESGWRHLVFNTRTKSVVRLDGIGQACRLLPEDQGIIFPGGYYLETGVHKTFDGAVDDLEYERTVRAANGEDVLYVFHARAEGRTLLLPYNLIRERVATPITCHGYSLFDDGTMVVFRALSDEPTRVHTMQVWQTPFVADTHAAGQPAGSGALARVGNAELVRGLSDCLAVARMVEDMTPTTAVFEALIAACVRTADHHHWLADPELGELGEPIAAVRATAEQALDEFAKVAERTAAAAADLDAAGADITGLIRLGRSATHRSAHGWVDDLAALRAAAGRLEQLRALRYIDTDRVAELADEVTAALADTGRRCLEFLDSPTAFDDYVGDLDDAAHRARGIATVAEATPIRDWLTERITGLHAVTEVVTELDTTDPTVRTRVLEHIGSVLAAANATIAVLDGRRAELAAAESAAAFTAEYALLGQAVTSALTMADSPETCEDQLTRLLGTVDEMETRFGDLAEHADQLTARREDIYEAFAARRQALLDERAQRADRLAAAARRVLAGVERRSAALRTQAEVDTYFAADAMVTRLRATIAELRAIGETVRAEELDGRIAAARQEAGRVLRDRTDLYVDGGATIRLGRHRFAVNTTVPELVLVPEDGAACFRITGTDYRAPVSAFSGEDAELWAQQVVSESPLLYRGEYLATALLAEAERCGGLDELHAAAESGSLGAVVRAATERRYDEGYQPGVHDHDATVILTELLRARAAAGLLRYRPVDRAAAQLWWRFGMAEDARTRWSARIGALARLAAMFAEQQAHHQLRHELATAIAEFAPTLGFDGLLPELAAAYLFDEIAAEPAGFVTARAAARLVESFGHQLHTARADYDRDLAALADDLPLRTQLVTAWLTGYLTARGEPADHQHLAEAVAITLCGSDFPRYPADAEFATTATGLLGTHPRIAAGSLPVRLDELTARAHSFRADRVPAFRAHLRRRTELLAAERTRLRMHEYQPKVMSGFVRNQLLDTVYLPLIGDNLAKQLGTTGAGKRTDQSGLLLLISPPGYGKTTLMEYVAARLGLVFVKVDGPSLGHRVHSLDPAEAPDAAARREVERINFALELGNNVLLYLDDIQHTSPELLQKFIALCDGQRRMEGVRDGETRTYELRGKRFAVAMAGNPYTEQGKRFRLPDMLANRADVWNLGDVLSGRDEAFALSYLENALITNPVLAPLSARASTDLDILVRLARGDDTARTDQLDHPYTEAELADIVAVLRKLLHVQRVVTTVNQAYIASAATADSARTEPPFQLQGSYRNTNAMAARIVAVLDDNELEALIDDHYRGEAQTLAAGAEANLLRLAVLRGRATPAELARWAEIKAAFVREQALGSGDDPLDRAVGGLGLLADRLGAVEAAIRGIDSGGPTGQHAAGKS